MMHRFGRFFWIYWNDGLNLRFDLTRLLRARLAKVRLFWRLELGSIIVIELLLTSYLLGQILLKGARRSVNAKFGSLRLVNVCCRERHHLIRILGAALRLLCGYIGSNIRLLPRLLEVEYLVHDLRVVEGGVSLVIHSIWRRRNGLAADDGLLRGGVKIRARDSRIARTVENFIQHFVLGVSCRRRSVHLAKIEPFIGLRR